MYSGVSGTEAWEEKSKYIGSKLLIMERIKSCFSLLISWVKIEGWVVRYGTHLMTLSNVLWIIHFSKVFVKKKNFLIEILPIQGVCNTIPVPVHQCSGFESVSFWASRIQIRNYLYGSGSSHQDAKRNKKTLDFFSFVLQEEPWFLQDLDFLITCYQCWGSVSFWHVFGSADP